MRTIPEKKANDDENKMKKDYQNFIRTNPLFSFQKPFFDR